MRRCQDNFGIEIRKSDVMHGKVAWLFGINTVNQIISWIITIIVARTLNPIDYGLMEMATILVGYAGVFGDIGFGAAIIQRTNPNEKELSSAFWLVVAISTIIAVCCVPISYVTRYVFDDERLIPLAQAMGIAFILNGLQIVPISILNRNLEFKKIALIEMAGTVVACCSMLIIAYLGGGAWTLIGGLLARSTGKLVFSYWIVKWLPELHFKLAEAKEYAKFGSSVALGRSLFYFYDASDRFFGGRAWSASVLGYYSLALTLSKLPTEKITVIINQISFPVFSRLQNSQAAFNDFYLKMIQVTVTLVFPLFIGGYLLSQELITVILGNKWVHIVYIFKFLCIAQIVTSLNAINGFVHYAQGRPNWSLAFHSACGVLMPVSFWVAAKHGIDAMVIPWISIYTLLCGAWIFITITKIGISVHDYLKNVAIPALCVSVMCVAILAFDLCVAVTGTGISEEIVLGGRILLGCSSYVLALYFVDRAIIKVVLSFLGFDRKSGVLKKEG